MQLLSLTSIEPDPEKHASGNDTLRVGVVGYSAQAFNQDTALLLIQEVFDLLEPVANVEIISGLTQLGIPALAYEEAVRRGWKTVGVACIKAFEYKCFPVDEMIIAGSDWGEESPTFLSMIDVLVRIGGGKQSNQETHMAKILGKRVMEFELPALLSN